MSGYVSFSAEFGELELGLEYDWGSGTLQGIRHQSRASSDNADPQRPLKEWRSQAPFDLSSAPASCLGLLVYRTE